MKRLICVLLSLTMIFSFSACQKKTEEPIFTFSCLNNSEEENQSIDAAFLEDEPGKNGKLEAPDLFSIDGELIASIGYPSVSEVVLAHETGRVQGMYLPLCTAQYICEDTPELKISVDAWRSLYQMATNPANKVLLEQIDQKLGDWLADGTLATLIETYIGSTAHAEANIPTISMPVFADKPTYKVAVTGSVPPFDYVSPDGVATGFNVALLAALGEALSVNFEPIVVTPDARMAALASGRVDFLFWTKSTNTPRTSTTDLLLTRPYYTTPNAYVTTDAHYALVEKISTFN